MAYIPNKLYVGFRADNEDTLTCFMTPLANDSAFTKRKKTIDDWASKDMSSTEISNEPRTGFRLVDTSRRWNSNNVVFRVIHPEVGAEFEISAENLSNIMSNTDIIKGEIQDKLLLIREGSKNILVIENSPEHKGSSEVDDNGKELFLKKDDYNIGDRVSVKGVGEVIYLGKNKVHYYEFTINTYGASTVKLNEGNESGHILYDNLAKKCYIHSAPKVLKNLGSTEFTVNDIIGTNFGYRGVVYEVGDLKEPEYYEYKLQKNDNTYSYSLLKNGSNYEAVYKHGNQYSSYGSVTVDLPTGIISNITQFSTRSSYQQITNGMEFYQLIKVLK